MSGSIIEAMDLRKQFGPVTAVAGINFRVSVGECYGLLGPNGAGKSSTFRRVCCVSPVSGGRLMVNGEDVTSQERLIKSAVGGGSTREQLGPRSFGAAEPAGLRALLRSSQRRRTAARRRSPGAFPAQGSAGCQSRHPLRRHEAALSHRTCPFERAQVAGAG